MSFKSRFIAKAHRFVRSSDSVQPLVEGFHFKAITGVYSRLVYCNVVFKEDQSRAREGYAAQNLATLRRLALNALNRENSKRSMRPDQAANDSFRMA